MQAGTELVGRYALEELLGSGGMGDVWRASDRQLERPVAVKVMRNRLDDPRRFQREARIAARFQHPGITVIHDVGTHDDQPFIVMELLHGSDLATVLNRTPGRRLPIETAISLIVEAATALQAAHSAQVIHRDLKPANLFRQNAGPLKICDFGVAQIADAVDGLTTAGHVIGTVSYMSPEQCQGDMRMDGRSDLYSLGCVLYELLTGRPPFRDGNARQIMNQQITMSPVRPRDLRGEIPGSLETLMLSMLAKNPARRPASASSLVAALEAVLGRGTPGTSRGGRSGVTAQAQRPPAADGERTITSQRGRTRRASTVRNTPVWHPEPTLLAGLPPPAHLQPELQVAPSTDSWSLVAFHPQGQWLASTDGDGTIALWEAASGAPLRSWSAGTHVIAMTASPGNRLAVGGGDGCVRVWDVRTAVLSDQFCGHAGGVQAVALDRAGIRLATGDANGVVRVWSPGSSQPDTTCRAAYGAVTALAFDVSGRRVAAGGEDDTVRIWDVGGSRRATLLAERAYPGEVTAVAFGAAAEVAVGGADGEVRPWDLESSDSPQIVCRDQHGSILTVAWDTRHERWICIGTDGRLHADGSEPQALVPHGRIRAASMSLAAGRGAVIDDSNGRIHTFRVGDPSASRTLRGSSTGLVGVAFGPSSGSLVIGGADNVLHVWEPRREALDSLALRGSYGISAMASSPGGQLAAVCREDGSVTVYAIDGQSSRLAEKWSHQCPEPAAGVAFSPDGSRIVTAGDAVRVWQTATGDADEALPGSGHLTRAAAYDPSGRHLAATGTDGAVLVWDVDKEVLRHSRVGHKGTVYTAAFSSQSGQLATAGSDGRVNIWDPDSGEIIRSLDGWNCHARALAFSPADGALALGCTDGMVRFREPRNWTEAYALPGHIHGITAMGFADHGERLATASRDGTVRVWDLATARAELILFPGQERWVAVAADGAVHGPGGAAGLVWLAAGLHRQSLGQSGSVDDRG